MHTFIKHLKLLTCYHLGACLLLYFKPMHHIAFFKRHCYKLHNYVDMLMFITRYMSLVCYLVNLSLILPTSFSLLYLNSVLYVAVLEVVSLQISCSGHQATIITSNHMTHSNCWQLVFHNTAVHQSVHLCDVLDAFLLSSY